MNDTFLKLKSIFPEHAELYLVGGCVRDYVLNDCKFENVKDFDVELHKMKLKEVEHYLEKSGEEYCKVGKSFGVYKLKLDGLDFDVSLPRKDSKTGSGHCGFEVEIDPFMGLKEASKRRDFTINSVSMFLGWGVLPEQVYYHQFFDYHGGLEDLKNKVLRMVDPETFGDDPLRVLRGMQFAGRFGLTVEPETFEKMKELV